MSNFKKLTIAALAVIFLIGATPIAAELDGIWEGHGDGTWRPPSGIVPVHPWQTWKGTVENGRFYGEWYDSTGAHGRFQGVIPSLTQEVAYCEGFWTWVDEGCDPPREITVGPFEMDFHYVIETCRGAWWSELTAVPQGHMWGRRTGP
ncbi:hypothetical protein CEE36_02870 [candidate division TA06 bacterium B3_TA06]|uniref:Uncharacterized protein n=1 Tax=candidate division TA06 bacterium B3_TA06 TaxID=2012487 RepID=A0A532V920_UNCT6|nr:MAG: hypothetical protein CEE36_02870 [candidate division TA06 bacterium B3_TA06]